MYVLAYALKYIEIWQRAWKSSDDSDLNVHLKEDLHT